MQKFFLDQALIYLQFYNNNLMNNNLIPVHHLRLFYFLEYIKLLSTLSSNHN